MELPERKHNSLQEFDYSSAGYYFITICTVNKQKILCNIVGDEADYLRVWEYIDNNPLKWADDEYYE
ncbi:MAG: hypothetical protein KBS52_03865 [Clostridiales bacterium]|nr:hypothetical protein [Candidatus Equinaster intestinalis]